MPYYTVLTGQQAQDAGFANSMPTLTGNTGNGSAAGANGCVWTNTPSLHDPVVTGLTAGSAGDALLTSTFADKWAQNDATAQSGAGAGTCAATIPANDATGSFWSTGDTPNSSPPSPILASLTNAGADGAQLAALSAVLGTPVSAVWFVVTLTTCAYDFTNAADFPGQPAGRHTGSDFNTDTLGGAGPQGTCNDGLNTYNAAFSSPASDPAQGGTTNSPMIYLAETSATPPPPTISVPPVPISIGGGGGWGKGVLAIYPAGGMPGAAIPTQSIEPIPPGPPVVALLCIPCCQMVFGYAI